MDGGGVRLESMGNSKSALGPEQISFSEGGPWQNRSKLEKCLIVFLILFFIAAAIFLILFIVYYNDSEKVSEPETCTPLDCLETVSEPNLVSEPETSTTLDCLETVSEPETCTTLDCLETASFVGQSMNDNVNPCDDFYQFACGRWLERHPLTPSKAMIDSFGLVAEVLNDRVRELLEERDPNAIDAFKKTRALYRSCVDTDSMDAKSTAPLMDLLMKNRSNFFPTLEPTWKDENLTLNQILTRLEGVGGMKQDAFISMNVKTDEKQSDKHVIYLSQQGLALLNRPDFVGERNSSNLMRYQKLYEDLTTNLGADSSTSKQDASDLVDFEIKLANATLSRQMLRDREKLYHNMTVQELGQKYPQFNWLDYLQGIFTPLGINITKDEKVVLDNVPYFDKIFDIIKSTPNRVLQNYCVWTIVRTFTKQLDKKSREIHDAFSRAKSGATRTTDRWKTCVKQLVTLEKDTVGRMYVERHFPQDSRSRVITMIGDLKDAFKEMIQEADWMTDGTKTAALDKLAAVVDKVGFPVRVMNDTYLNEQYKDITFKDDDFFHNTVQHKRQNRAKALLKLRKPVNREEWPESAAIVNAFYHVVTNSIFFPAGILKRPFYDDKFLDAMNYGAIGVVIGHEITHGFDISGRSFDKIGNLRMWWQEQDLQKFEDRTKCIIDQYSGYVEPVVKQHVNGKLTIGEDIADNGGMKEAYRAYRKLIAKRGKEEARLPVINYTPDQLFFITSAQIWCRNMSPELRMKFLKLDFHSPNQFRVIGPLQNSEDFSRVFNCSKGSYMNPEKKCNVW